MTVMHFVFTTAVSLSLFQKRNNDEIRKCIVSEIGLRFDAHQNSASTSVAVMSVRPIVSAVIICFSLARKFVGPVAKFPRARSLAQSPLSSEVTPVAPSLNAR